MNVPTFEPRLPPSSRMLAWRQRRPAGNLHVGDRVRVEGDGCRRA
jgi:hypothetical protein